jgi:archaellum biogenesis protein FlaJ (TadC family)
MPFCWAKLLLGLATVVISVIILAILLGIAWLFKSEGVGAVMFFVWLILTGIVRFVMDLTPSDRHKNKRGIKLKERKRWERKAQNGVFTRRNSKPRL